MTTSYYFVLFNVKAFPPPPFLTGGFYSLSHATLSPPSHLHFFYPWKINIVGDREPCFLVQCREWVIRIFLFAISLPLPLFNIGVLCFYNVLEFQPILFSSICVICSFNIDFLFGCLLPWGFMLQLTSICLGISIHFLYCYKLSPSSFLLGLYASTYPCLGISTRTS